MAAERPTWFVLGGLDGVALALLVAAALGSMLARVRIADRARLLPLLGVGVSGRTTPDTRQAPSPEPGLGA